jgi:hypothetical protein
MKAPAPDTGNYKVLGSSQADYTILAWQEGENGKLTFRLLPKAKTVSGPKKKSSYPGPSRTKEHQNLSHFNLLCAEKSHLIHSILVRQGLFKYSQADTLAPTSHNR